MAKKKKKFTGLWMPKSILQDGELTANEKFFLAEIVQLSKKTYCIASNGHFADLFKVSKPNCTRIIKSLEAKGYITNKIQREGKRIVKRMLKAKQGYYQNDNKGTIKTATTYYQNSNNLLSKAQREITDRKQIENSDLNLKEKTTRPETLKEKIKKYSPSILMDDIEKMMDEKKADETKEEKAKPEKKNTYNGGGIKSVYGDNYPTRIEIPKRKRFD